MFVAAARMGAVAVAGLDGASCLDQRAAFDVRISASFGSTDRDRLCSAATAGFYVLSARVAKSRGRLKTFRVTFSYS